MPLSETYDRALVYASVVHREQTRKGTTIPYVSHVLAVSSLVLEHGGDETAAIAALLHDAAEDQGGESTLREIETLFGAAVAGIVRDCSDALPAPGREKPPWRARKTSYLEHLRSAAPRTLLVSASDKVHNLRAILADLRTHGDGVWERFKGGKEGSLWYYRELAAIFKERGPEALATELARILHEVERLAA
jgi:(p)ppGpp synthase/HD superfamily hydrolase